MKNKETKGKIQMDNRSQFIKNYKDLSVDEMIDNVGIKEEGQLSDDENTLNDILMYHKNSNKITYSLLKMKSLCERLISEKCNEIEFFENQLKLIQNSLK